MSCSSNVGQEFIYLDMSVASLAWNVRAGSPWRKSSGVDHERREALSTHPGPISRNNDSVK
jgi:hypothetical protein